MQRDHEELASEVEEPVVREAIFGHAGRIDVAAAGWLALLMPR